jgi:Uma2 family endonuclease
MPMKWTYADYARLPADGKIHEIIDGWHYNHPTPRIRHQDISREIERFCEPYVRAHRAGRWLSAPVDVVLSEHDIVQPDKVFVSAQRAAIIGDAHIRGAPDLVVEITSPTDPAYDKETKFKLYARHGVPYYWIVDSQLEQVEEYRHTGGGYEPVRTWKKGDIFRPQIFAGLLIPVAELFPD